MSQTSVVSQTPDEKWSGFLSRTVHEMRTPLSSILMLAELLADDEDRLGDREIDKARKIHQATTDVLGLLAEVSEYGKIEGGRIQVYEDDVLTAELTRKIEDDFRLAAQEQGLGLEVEVEDNLPLSFRGDRGRIEQILGHMLSQALLSADQGRIVVHMRLGASETFAVTVRDEGPAVPDEQRATFFEPLLHARVGSRRKHGGQGLGLAIAEALARRLGGELVLAPSEGREDDRGNVLALSLPLH